MGDLGEKLAAAFKEKKNEKLRIKNDMNNWVWKGPKKEVAGVRCQSTIKMVDATPEQLKEMYNHCISMLFNESNANPGRYNLKKIVQEQIDNCTTELCVRWIEGRYFSSEDVDPENRGKLPRNLLYKELLNIKDKPENKDIPREEYNNITLRSSVMSNLPVEFQDVTINQAMAGALDQLGVFNRKHITLTFLLKLGIELTPEELKEFNVPSKKVLEEVRERLKIPSYLKLHRSDKGLSFKELESLVHLREARYSNMSNDKLLLLKNKVLYRFIREIEYQILQWEDIIKKLQRVATEKHNFSLLPESVENSIKTNSSKTSN